jgi:acyl-CoA dehydrogenase
MTVLDIRTGTALRRRRTDMDRAAAPGAGSTDLRARARAVAAVAARAAVAVDREGRFPAEAIAAARSERLLGVLVPAALGGDGASVSDVADICYTLGRACASTAMIFAMHQTKVACVVRHGRGSAWHEGLLRRLGAEQLLLASSTTEGKGGGDVRSSAAPILRDGARIALDREATVISYGAEADGIVTTARRAVDATSSDQVLVVLLKQDYALDRMMEWDTLGMRGTCSAGFRLRAEASAGQILPEPYESIHAGTMTPVAHLTWAAVWTGIAAGAVDRAHAFVRKAARQAGGQLPPGAAHLTRATAGLKALRALVDTGLRRWEETADDPRALAALDFQTAMNLLKVDASEQAVAIVMSALRACGLSGYRNDTDVSVGRHLRDVLSSPLMINNDRILANIAAASLMSGVPASLRD